MAVTHEVTGTGLGGQSANHRSRSLVRDTLTTTGWGGLGKAVGFLVPFFIAAWFGVSGETDAFFFVYGLVLFLAGFFAPAAENIIVPYIAEARARQEQVGRFIGRIMATSGLAILGLVGAMLLVGKPLLSLLTDFNGPTLDMVYRLLLVTSPLILLLVWTGVLSGTLNAYKRFFSPAISPAVRALVCLAVIGWLKGAWGVQAIALGYVAGELVRMLVLFAVIGRLGIVRISFSLRPDPQWWSFVRTASYQMAGMLAVGLNPLVDKTMASWLAPGSVSVLYYADRLYFIPVTLAGTGLAVAILSHWSDRYFQAGLPELKRSVSRAVRTVALLASAGAVLLVLLRGPAVRLAFYRGEFAAEKLPAVEWTWVCYLLGFVPQAVSLLYVNAHVVMRQTRVLLWSALGVNGLNITFNYLLMRPMGVAGIALSTSLSAFFLMAVLGIFFSRTISRERLAA